MIDSTLKRFALCAFGLTCALFVASPARGEDLAQVAQAIATPAPAPTDAFYDGKLHIAFTPYVWLPTLNGTFRYNLSDIHLPSGEPGHSGTIDSSVGPNKYLSNLNFALMGNIQFRFGNTALDTDFINVNIGNQTSALLNLTGRFGHVSTTLTGTARSRAVGTIAQAAGSNTFYRKDNTTVDVLLGGRMVFLTASTDWNLTGANGIINKSGSAARSSTMGDAIVGSFGQFGLGKRWAIPFYVDLGTGDPNFTWQGILGIKYGNLGLTYRYLDYSNGGASLLQNLRLNGPQIGYTIKF